jgi:hypothetical protein
VLPTPRGTEPSVFWIKCGRSIVWNELAGQKKARDGLRNLVSQVKAPAVYYACQVAIPYKDDPDGWPAHRTYVVMEYVPGRAAAQRCNERFNIRKDSFCLVRVASHPSAPRFSTSGG